MASKIKADQFETLDGSGNITLNNSVTMASTKTLPAASLTGTLPAISGANLTALTAANLTGALPAISGANLTGVTSVGGATGADFNDNTKLRFGTGNDLEIYHDGSNSYIDDTGTGNLLIKGQNLKLLGSNGDNIVFGQQGGAVTLYHNNAPKLATSATGGTLTGTWTGAGKVLSYAAGQINLSSGIAHSGNCTITGTGVTFAITSTVTNSNFIIHASGWTPHLNPSGSTSGNIGAAHWLYRKVNSGSYNSATSLHPYSDFITGGSGPAYNWDNMTGQMHIYDSALTHTAGDVITYQFYVEPYNCSDSGYFHHTGGDGAATLSWSILEVN